MLVCVICSCVHLHCPRRLIVLKHPTPLLLQNGCNKTVTSLEVRSLFIVDVQCSLDTLFLIRSDARAPQPATPLPPTNEISSGASLLSAYYLVLVLGYARV